MKRMLFMGLLVTGLGWNTYAKPASPVKHTVKKGENLYSISRSYGVKVGELLKANPAITSNKNLKIGQHLVIPKGGAAASAITRPVHETALAIPGKKVMVPSTPDVPYREEDNRPRTKEAAVADIRTIDPVLPKTTIAESREDVASDAAAFSLRTSSSNVTEYPSIFGQYSTHGFKPKTNRGAANYIADNTSGNPYLALYNNAETGSLIKVTNLMNKRAVYVKVVGKVPPNEASRDVILKLGNKAAQELGAVDEKFLVEVVGFSSN